MSLPRLWIRVERLEQQVSDLVWSDDVRAFLVAVVREASDAECCPCAWVAVGLQ